MFRYAARFPGARLQTPDFRVGNSSGKFSNFPSQSPQQFRGHLPHRPIDALHLTDVERAYVLFVSPGSLGIVGLSWTVAERVCLFAQHNH